MKTNNLDIIYFIKPGLVSEEARFSMRSLKNLPHRNVWVYGNKAFWMNNIHYVPAEQIGTKWENTSHLMEMVVQNPDISDNFIVMNDDFFILKPIDNLEYFYEGDLDSRVERTRLQRFMFEKAHYSRYGLLLKETNEWLKSHGYDNRNFEMHLPMIFNKKKMAKCLEAFPEGGYAARRSLYGNMWKVKATNCEKDCKVYGTLGFPAPGIVDFVSTTDRSFAKGVVGTWLRRYFSEKGPYEK